MARWTPRLILCEIWYRSWGLHLIGAPHIEIDLVALSQLFFTELSTQHLHQEQGRLRITDGCSLSKHSRATDEVLYHGYLTNQTRRARKGGGTRVGPLDQVV
jgi:hypothetical protein